MKSLDLIKNRLDSLNADDIKYPSTVKSYAKELFNYPQTPDRLKFIASLCKFQVPLVLGEDPQRAQELADLSETDIFSSDITPLVPGSLFFPVPRFPKPDLSPENLKQVLDVFTWHPKKLQEFIFATFPFTSKVEGLNATTVSDLISFVLLLYTQNIHAIVVKLDDPSPSSVMKALAAQGGHRVSQAASNFWKAVLIKHGEAELPDFEPIQSEVDDALDFIRGRPQGRFYIKNIHYGLLGLLCVQLGLEKESRLYFEIFQDKCGNDFYSQSCLSLYDTNERAESTVTNEVGADLMPPAVTLFDTLDSFQPSKKERIAKMLMKLHQEDEAQALKDPLRFELFGLLGRLENN